MRIAELIASAVKVPLKREIKHAAASRRHSLNLFVCCRLADGTEGWGEGVPRQSITGETAQGALAQLEVTDVPEQLGADCQSWSDVLAMCQRFQPKPPHKDPRHCGGNALRCAVELSVLDAFGKLFSEPVSAVTAQFAEARSLSVSHARVRYSTTITIDATRWELTSAMKMRLFGFRDCKLKVGVGGAAEPARVQRIRRCLGPRVDLRLDANGAWDASQARTQIEQLLPWNISCIEQPVPHEQVAALAELRRQLPVPLMLDESLTSLQDAELAIEQQTCDLFNIRLSKCGGFLNSLRLAARAREAGLGYQLGCHPGESPVLSAAGRHWAVSVRDVKYLEGSYDRFLLNESFSEEDISFGYGGRAAALPGPGLGITVKRRALERLTVQRRTIPVNGHQR
jgi:muconate cycloisomerase